MKSNDLDNYQEKRLMNKEILKMNELMELMKSYINVQMDKDTTKKMSLEKELADIKKISTEIQNRMISILKKQESMLNQSEIQLKKTLENGTIDLKKNTNKVLTGMQSIENELSKGIENLNSQNKESLNLIEKRTSDLVDSTRKSALITHWIDAFKYGFATAVILLLVLIPLIKFKII